MNNPSIRHSKLSPRHSKHPPRHSKHPSRHSEQSEESKPHHPILSSRIKNEQTHPNNPMATSSCHESSIVSCKRADSHTNNSAIRQFNKKRSVIASEACLPACPFTRRIGGPNWRAEVEGQSLSTKLSIRQFDKRHSVIAPARLPVYPPNWRAELEGRIGGSLSETQACLPAVVAGQSPSKTLRIALLSFVSCLLFVAPAHAATLRLTPQQLNLTNQNSTTIRLEIDPLSQPIIGVDVILRYDPEFIHLTDITNTGTFPTMPAKDINNSTGIARFSLIKPYNVFQTVPATIADIVIKAQNPINQTSIDFDFTPDSTTDTNAVISGGIDTLTQALGTTITIRGRANPGNPPQPTRRPTNRPPTQAANPGNPNLPIPTNRPGRIAGLQDELIATQSATFSAQESNELEPFTATSDNPNTSIDPLSIDIQSLPATPQSTINGPSLIIASTIGLILLILGLLLYRRRQLQ